MVTADGYDLRFPGAEMKNRRPYAFAVAEGLVGPLARYLSQHRPVLAERSRFLDAAAAGPGSRLWLSKIGAPMTPSKLYERITTLTRQRFGHAVNPHAFRDEAATAIATRDPEHVRITMSVLGHTRLATSERYYNHAQAYEACRLYQKWIQALRR